MNQHQLQVFKDTCVALNLDINFTELDDGSIIAEAKDKVDALKAIREMIALQIETKLRLVKALEKNSKSKFDIERFRAYDELYTEKRKLLDLQMEYIGKDDYIRNYQHRVAFNTEIKKQTYEVALKELPKLIKKAESYIKKEGATISKTNGMLRGHIARYYLLDHENIDHVCTLYSEIMDLFRLSQIRNEKENKAIAQKQKGTKRTPPKQDEL